MKSDHSEGTLCQRCVWFCLLVCCFMLCCECLHAQERLRSLWLRPQDSTADTSNSSDLQINGFQYEVNAVRAGRFLAFGANVRVDLFYPFSLGVRLSLDVDAGTLYTIPYFGVTWPNVGGFEIGRLFRPTVTLWTVPYWETWRIWIGNEKSFSLIATCLSSVPLNSVGYYDGGISFAIDDKPDLIWIGLASISASGRAKGPACKTSWLVGNNSWVLARASYMLGKEEGDIGYTLTIGWRQEF